MKIVQELSEFGVGHGALAIRAEVQVHEVALEVERDLLVQGGQLDDALELIVGDVSGRVLVEQVKGGLVDRVWLAEQRFERLKLGERNQPVTILEEIRFVC